MTPDKVEAALGAIQPAIDRLHRYAVHDLADKLAEARLVLTEALAERGWRPIAEAPRDGTSILAYGTVCGMTGVFQTRWKPFGFGSPAQALFVRGEGPEGGFWYSERNWTQTWNPTHFLSIPAMKEPP